MRWELFKLSWREHPGLSAAVVVTLVTGVVTFAGTGLALRALVEATGAGQSRALALAALGAAVAFGLNWLVTHLEFTIRVHLAEKVGVTRIGPELMRMSARLPEIEHLERTDFQDRLATLHGETWALGDAPWAVLESAFLTLRLLVTLAVLGSVNPWLLLLLPCAGAQLWLDGFGRRRVTAAHLAAAEDDRVQRHLFADVCVNPAAAKEVLVAGVADRIVTLQREAWDRAARTRLAGRLAAAGWSSAGWLVFVAGFTAAIGLVSATGSPGDVVLAVVVGSQLRSAVEIVVMRSSEAASRATYLEPYRWLLSYFAEHAPTPGLPAPRALRTGITLDAVGYTYPGTTRPAVTGVSATLPAGSVVALVGEYGSGKTTLVKLLAKMYSPDSGHVTVDGQDLASLDTAGWRSVMSAAFQDFGRYQTTFAESVELGDLGSPIDAAVAEADAEGLAARLPSGGQTMLGKRFGGIELSEGQWQKVALARACMRREPLLFLLDEPTASLDAPSEQVIFERYMARARRIARRTGAITVIVSHRFSTVAGADLILVMEAGRLAEAGTHGELLARRGTYAQLYGIQATAYAQ
ncbi:ATP-binding cassette domain-containing protein [Nonomuraea sp. NPDC050663]|uniref:ATP-binding cassette domain-containing protein n=1 Tax=Nonomuraea sp. NPDC050663 TaxID=3364370 RepID=UPI00379C4659